MGGETLAVPCRICHGEPGAEAARSLTGVRRSILHCLCSRHGDGRIRQRHLEQITGLHHAWVAPYVVQPAGEDRVPPPQPGISG
ncbi:hypothetical protein [Streptomyces sp. NPDC058045]|uniref:hypothetical protein n=1 Tax=Streptomyces sp. NPDC058045 TaxID=3346311 RepID=UPI0036E29B55